jgi:hypothetical protein
MISRGFKVDTKISPCPLRLKNKCKFFSIYEQKASNQILLLTSDQASARFNAVLSDYPKEFMQSLNTKPSEESILRRKLLLNAISSLVINSDL